ncbi:hypothetical protein ACTGJ9_036095 [Bradyrhizobium sp. RDM12]
MRKTNLAPTLRGRPDGMFVAPFEAAEIGPELFGAACRMGLEASSQNDATDAMAPAGRRTGSR